VSLVSRHVLVPRTDGHAVGRASPSQSVSRANASMRSWWSSLWSGSRLPSIRAMTTSWHAEPVPVYRMPAQLRPYNRRNRATAEELIGCRRVPRQAERRGSVLVAHAGLPSVSRTWRDGTISQVDVRRPRLAASPPGEAIPTFESRRSDGTLLGPPTCSQRRRLVRCLWAASP
jgi:hypothetical protein